MAAADSPRVHWRRFATTPTLSRYARHRPENTVLYAVVGEHIEAFYRDLGEQGASLPGFVHREFERYLRCGRLEHGFVRVKCTHCRHEHLVAFSCKCRGFCPSCGARRMVDIAAHLVDHVLPRVPVRQWVLSFPWPLRLLFAARPELLTRVLGVVTRALSSAVVRRPGLRAGAGAETGTVTFIQRFGSALNLNVHLHLLVLDGAFTFAGGYARFHRAAPPTDSDIGRLLEALVRRIVRTLNRAGALVMDPREEGAQPCLDLSPVPDDGLAQLQSASVRYRIAVGPIAERKSLRLRAPGAALPPHEPAKPLTATGDDFSLNAAVACRADERRKLEWLCRYVARPPIALERLSRDGDALVVHALKHPFRDATTELLFEPLDFIARLAALVPRPRSHLRRYHGILAPNARHRRLVVPATPPRALERDDEPAPPRSPAAIWQRTSNRFTSTTWPRRSRAPPVRVPCWRSSSKPARATWRLRTSATPSSDPSWGGPGHRHRRARL